jgi:hypothetical protein
MSDFNFDEPVTAPAKKSILAKLAGLSTKVKIITAASVSLLIGGGGAFAYSALNTPEAIVGLALAGAFSEAHPSLEVDVAIKSPAANGSGSVTLYTSDAGSLAAIKAQADIAGQPVGATLNVLAAKSGDIYANLADFDSLGYYLVTTGLVPEPTVTSARGVLNGTWVQITKAEVDTYTAAATAGQTCISSKLSDTAYAKKVSSEFTSTLRDNNFIVVKKELPQVDGDRVFELGLSADKLRSFATELKKTALYADVTACSPTLNISDSQIQQINQTDIDNAFKQAGLSVKLQANGFSHKLTKISIDAADASSTQSLNITLKPLGDQSSKVVVPSKSTTVTELLTALSTPSY